MIDLIHGSGTIEKELPAMVRQFARFGIDMVRDPILVFPTLHYQNGGVTLKPDGATSIPNLYGAGEISGGVHGRNRLMGNSLLEVTVYGRRAGLAAGQQAKETTLGRLTLDHVASWEKALDQAGIDTDLESPMILPDYAQHRR
jgi:succinate dehydrogenase / fumarate reductase flavoprotein subunit